ncbi:hypothetical protein DVH05_008811 [Phytophthora capsici]|nr:hypothetical protein DVH05_008811 [Phytophthora capsici]
MPIFRDAGQRHNALKPLHFSSKKAVTDATLVMLVSGRPIQIPIQRLISRSTQLQMASSLSLAVVNSTKLRNNFGFHAFFRRSSSSVSASDLAVLSTASSRCEP